MRLKNVFSARICLQLENAVPSRPPSPVQRLKAMLKCIKGKVTSGFGSLLLSRHKFNSKGKKGRKQWAGSMRGGWVS